MITVTTAPPPPKPLTVQIEHEPGVFDNLFRLFGYRRKPEPYTDEPCFIVDDSGTVHASTLRTFSGGQLAVYDAVFWKEAFPDGTVSSRFIKKWHRP